MSGNTHEAMRDLASRLWGRFLRERVLEEMTHEVNAFRAEVVTNNGNGTLTVRRPFESGNLTLRAAASMSGAKAGDQVLILGIGEKRKALSNAFILCKTDLSTFVSEETVLAAFALDTASGNPANFPDGANNIPMEGMTVSIALTQTGSGNASPSNIRPILSWTGAEISRSGPDTTQPDTASVSWGQNVYAGTLDAFAGGMTATWIDLDMSGSTYVTKTSTYVQARASAPVGIAHILSDRFSYQIASGTVGRMAVSGGYLYFNIPVGEVNSYDTNGITAWFSTHNPQFVYEPTASVELASSTVSINTLLGENNVWADCGAVTVTYRADPTLYIQKKLGA